MKILLRKVTHTPLEFEINSNKITFKGFLEYHSRKLVLLKAKLMATVVKPCDICAEDLQLSIDEEIEFFLSDCIYEEDAQQLE